MHSVYVHTGVLLGMYFDRVLGFLTWTRRLKTVKVQVNLLTSKVVDLTREKEARMSVKGMKTSRNRLAWNSERESIPPW